MQFVIAYKCLLAGKSIARGDGRGSDATDNGQLWAIVRMQQLGIRGMAEELDVVHLKTTVRHFKGVEKKEGLDKWHSEGRKNDKSFLTTVLCMTNSGCCTMTDIFRVMAGSG
ncbi:unnamed protein product [Angiostrongylus costaricensis]|uniref:HTH_48 domain-containing protein n=1 Tax=Angiostrongylus costaricensis TaxID=334426 RepID=A0A0R3PJL4_ANGCS|nr:unnamed protein product [Angiostrongylus costaricensis]